MTEFAYEQGRWDPPIAGDAAATLLGFLERQRATFAWKSGELDATCEWTFKDVVAHLNGWRRVTLARLDAAQHGNAPAAPPWPAALNEDEEDDLDTINAWIYQSNRELTERDHYPWLTGYALGDVITSTFGHLHEEHEPVLRDWLDRDKRANA